MKSPIFKPSSIYFQLWCFHCLVELPGFLAVHTESVFGHYRWQIEHLATSTLHEVSLHHLNTTASSRWGVVDDLSNSCSFSSTNSSTTRLSCLKPGNVVVQLRTTDTPNYVDWFTVTLEPRSHCLTWTMVRGSSLPGVKSLIQLPSNSSKEQLYLWLYAPEYASEDERSYRVAKPSASTKMLTTHLHHLGEKPSVEFSHGISQRHDLVFDATLGAWVLNVSTSGASVSRITVQGRGVATQNCQISRESLRFTVRKYEPSFPNVLSSSSSSSSWSSNQIPLRRDACVDTIMAIPIIGSRRFWFSQDTFSTADLLQVPIGDEAIVDLGLTQHAMVVLTNASVWYTTNMQTIQRSSGLPSNMLYDHVQVAEACDPLLDHYFRKSSTSLGYMIGTMPSS